MLRELRWTLSTKEKVFSIQQSWFHTASLFSLAMWILEECQDV